MAKAAASKHVRKDYGKINPADWPKIRGRRQAGETYEAIAGDYGVTAAAIWSVCNKTEKQVREKLAKQAARKSTASRTNGSAATAKTVAVPVTMAWLQNIETLLKMNLEQVTMVRQALFPGERPSR
jgi:hypothetical protein